MKLLVVVKLVVVVKLLVIVKLVVIVTPCDRQSSSPAFLLLLSVSKPLLTRPSAKPCIMQCVGDKSILKKTPASDYIGLI